MCPHESRRPANGASTWRSFGGGMTRTLTPWTSWGLEDCCSRSPASSTLLPFRRSARRDRARIGDTGNRRHKLVVARMVLGRP